LLLQAHLLFPLFLLLSLCCCFHLRPHPLHHVVPVPFALP
jgi:hypothetical protein